ncbi:HAAAP family serine/threonine permease [Aeromonas jandaei]|uniref:HAAAP family serine/threonine permease n=1 Tax=Aeromonas jandaei TaxID=650 RepID=A0ABD7EK53_AERJA|nr:HAAAP family serine/threonine permease [Aeromonas jandaei]QXC38329.1 HAAAP family serine/threonine permease [Aeromonas sp. FDAARGOS 1410]MBL0628513.1 HAAAP family serine/threonine permease [Aeromonas jandaei]QSR71246.1 HAAAP family serine/threonine permease [Aeromonas jandaei]QTL96012.1 Serine transporter [Aeromonas jandaei]QWL61385.1 HAAAP family serine/threonine permease [Aeromonas jandaei]
MSVSIAEKSNPVSKLKWEKSDSVWTMGLYATAVGAGTLFLPITVGSNSPVILLFILLLAFPLSYYSHRALSRFVLSSSHKEGDITHVVEEHFGARAGKLLMLVYLMAFYPIILVYSISITNAIQSFVVHQLGDAEIPRGLLVLGVMLGLHLVLLAGKQIVVSAISVLALPMVAFLIGLSIYLLPQWSLSYFSESQAVDWRDPAFWKSLWLIVPVMVFSFSHAPIISSFSAAQKKRCQESADLRAKRIIKCSSLLICGSVLFFVVSCVMSLSQAEMAQARIDNISVLSALANKFSNPLIAYVGPLIAILAMSKSFLGTSMGVSEGTVSMVSGACQGLGLSLRETTIARVSSVILFVVTGVITYLNPNVLEIIEKVSGPLIAVILFLLPACSIYRLPALKRYRGASTLFVLVIGLLAISALIYDLL